MKPRQLVVAITGASGAIYGLRLGRELLRAGCCVAILISSAGFAVLREECGLNWETSPDQVLRQLQEHFQHSGPELAYYAANDFLAPMASGSAAPDAMVVCPCSMGTLARIACGNSGNLLERTADVMLKEGRTLVLVPRETPLNAIHLENMLKLARLGVRLVPAMPAFYQQPASVDDMVNFVVGKVLDTLAIDHNLFDRWGDKSSTPVKAGFPDPRNKEA
jgi:4-hydroxy-3-polyprenylbenzoate decarboxylase